MQLLLLAAQHGDLSQGLWTFLASVTIKGQILTGLWIGRFGKY